MPGPHYPLWMYVTPCGGSVHWQLFHTQAPRDIGQLITAVWSRTSRAFVVLLQLNEIGALSALRLLA